MNIGLDIGYSATKAVSGNRQVTFPSVIGSPDQPRFAFSGDHTITLVAPWHIQIGESAITQSRFIQRREDRRWIESNEWYALFLAALTELTDATLAELRIVTGLPVAFFDDRKTLRDRLLGEHRTQREGRRAQVFRVVDCHVIPQPFGTLLTATLDDRGRIVDTALASSTVGVLDIGGKTTNILAAHRLTEIRRETASIDVGAWDAVRAVREWLSEHCPDLDLRDHQVAEAIIHRQVRYYGEALDLSRAVDTALEPLADQVIAAASQLWNGAAGLDAILVSGGGALLLGPYIQRHFRHARIVPDPVFANAVGFYRLAQRLGNTGTG